MVTCLGFLLNLSSKDITVLTKKTEGGGEGGSASSWPVTNDVTVVKSLRPQGAMCYSVSLG